MIGIASCMIRIGISCLIEALRFLGQAEIRTRDPHCGKGLHYKLWSRSDPANRHPHRPTTPRKPRTGRGRFQMSSQTLQSPGMTYSTQRRPWTIPISPQVATPRNISNASRLSTTHPPLHKRAQANTRTDATFSTIDTPAAFIASPSRPPSNLLEPRALFLAFPEPLLAKKPIRHLKHAFPPLVSKRYSICYVCIILFILFIVWFVVINTSLLSFKPRKNRKGKLAALRQSSFVPSL